jgi:hypothetical protein
MSSPYGMEKDSYYNTDYVYPIVSLDNQLMIVSGKSGTISTQEYSDKIYVYANIVI